MRGLLPEAATRRREVYCLQERLASFGLTTRITSKPVGATVRDRTPQTDAVAQFMADCAVVRIFGFWLYAAGTALNASRASAPLQAQCRSGVEAGHGIEVVDVCHEPEPALRDGICMTHTLPKPAPVAVGQVVGMLSAAATMVQALGLPEKRTTAS